MWQDLPLPQSILDKIINSQILNILLERTKLKNKYIKKEPVSTILSEMRSTETIDTSWEMESSFYKE